MPVGTALGLLRVVSHAANAKPITARIDNRNNFMPLNLHRQSTRRSDERRRTPRPQRFAYTDAAGGRVVNHLIAWANEALRAKMGPIVNIIFPVGAINRF
jgi:hypothetical protein